MSLSSALNRIVRVCEEVSTTRLIFRRNNLIYSTLIKYS